MDSTPFPVIDLVATGSNIQRLRQERGLSVRDLQRYFGFEEPRAIYKWQKGETLPTVDNLYALGVLLEVPMDGILVPVKRHSAKEQRETRCSGFFWSYRCHEYYPATLLTSELTVPIQSFGFRVCYFHSRLGPCIARGIAPRHAQETPRLL